MGDRARPIGDINGVPIVGAATPPDQANPSPATHTAIKQSKRKFRDRIVKPHNPFAKIFIAYRRDSGSLRYAPALSSAMSGDIMFTKPAFIAPEIGLESVYALAMVLTATPALTLNMTCASFLLDEARMPEVLKRRGIRQLHAIYLLTLVIGGVLAIITWGGLNLHVFASSIWNWLSSFFITLIIIGIVSPLSTPLGKSRYSPAFYVISSVATIALIYYAWFLYEAAAGA